MLIHFVHTGNAYLPELHAYVDFIQVCGHHARVHQRVDTVPGDAKVVWWMCGLVTHQAQRRFPNAFHIHEYASASTGRLCHLKDIYKRWVQPQPDYRIFQNEWVHARLGFRDALPLEYRDMGVTPQFFSRDTPSSGPDFDCVYLGEMQRLFHFLPLFERLAQCRRTVLLIGQLPEALRSYFDTQSNVSAIGRVSYAEVPALLKRARYGLNLVPNQLPYTQQTSTKLLEYCASGLNIVSTDYPWVRRFERQHDASFFFVPFRPSANGYPDLFGPTLDLQTYRTPSLCALAWPRVLKRMEVWQVLGLSATASM